MKTNIKLSSSIYWQSEKFRRLYNWWQEKNLELSVDSKEIPNIKTNDFLKSNWYSLGYYNWKLERCENALENLRNKRNITVDDKLEMLHLSRIIRRIERDIIHKTSKNNNGGAKK